jgi:hypothetical protein
MPVGPRRPFQMEEWRQWAVMFQKGPIRALLHAVCNAAAIAGVMLLQWSRLTIRVKVPPAHR